MSNMDPLPDRPRFAVVGAGAVGCYYGGRLAQHEHDVHWLLRSDFDHVRQHGMEIQSRDGDFILKPTALNLYRQPQEMPKADVVLVTLKTTANDRFQDLIAPLLHGQTAILTLQNGLGNEQQLADLFGLSRILGGLAFVCINRTSPGHIRHTDYGMIKIGEFGRPISQRLRQIASIFDTSKVECHMLEDLNMGRWEKLIWNVPFNGLGAALGLTTDRIVNHPDGLELVRQLMDEVVRTAHAAGIALDATLPEQNIRRTLTMGPYRSSMQIDRETHRPIELDAIIGNPLRTAQRLGVSTPRLQMLYAMLAMHEAAKLAPV
jgi:2-dehydropantoate 2-reductase